MPATRVDNDIIFKGGQARKLTRRERIAIKVAKWAGGKFAAKP